MSRVLFNLLVTYLVALLLVAGASVVLVFTVFPGPEALGTLTNRQFFVQLLQYFAVLLPVAVLAPPAFAFAGLHDAESRSQAHWVTPVVGFVLLGIGLSVVGQFFVSDTLLRLKMEAVWKAEEATLSEEIRRASDLEELESRWKRNPVASSAQVLSRLEAMGREFPFHLDLFRLMDRIRKDATLRGLEKKEPKRSDLLLGIEAKAEEARNRRDWATAVLLYGKLLEQVPPGRPFLAERRRLEAARDTVLALEAEPASRRTEAEVRETRFREELAALDGELSGGRVHEAFPKARDLLLLHPKSDEAKARYEKAEALMRRDEFLVQDYQLRVRFLTNAAWLGKTTFRVGEGTLTASRFLWSIDYVYLEEVVLIQGKTRHTYRFARAEGDRILLKNGDEKSLSFAVPGLSATLEQALLLLPAWHQELWLLSPLALEKYRVLATQGLGQGDRFTRALREAKWFLPAWILGLCLFLTGLSWWNREHLIDPLYFLALLFLIPLLLLVYFAGAYAAAWQSAALGVTPMRVALGAFCGVFALGSLVFLARMK